MKVTELLRQLEEFRSSYGDADVTIPTDETYEDIEKVSNTTDVEDDSPVCILHPKRLLVVDPDELTQEEIVRLDPKHGLRVVS